MPKLIRDGAIVDDSWRAPDAEAPPSKDRILTLEQWLGEADKVGSAVQLQAPEEPSALQQHLGDITLVCIYFAAFTDGRGFSYARELRERGFTGELRATGAIFRDQLNYLKRCGFNAFQLEDESALEDALASIEDFSDAYQASPEQPLPLFRRRA